VPEDALRGARCGFLMSSGNVRSAVCAPRVSTVDQPVACMRNLASWQSNQIDCTSRVKHFSSPCCCSYSSSRASKQATLARTSNITEACAMGLHTQRNCCAAGVDESVHDDEPLTVHACELSSICTTISWHCSIERVWCGGWYDMARAC
jgi:hypothetical protein